VNVVLCPFVLTLFGFQNLTGLDTAATATVVSSRPNPFLLFTFNFFYFWFRKKTAGTFCRTMLQVRGSGE
jgi:hypothetical protein